MQKKSPNPIDVSVGENLRQFRQFAGISQSSLGTALGLTFQQIQKYESGINRISASRLQEIATLLNVNVSAFFGEAKPVAIADGASIDPADPIIRFLQTSEGHTLNKSYWKLPKRLRHQILELAQAISN
ncbi:helix-turn-helix domain-containing protein [Rhizobiales bacterium RZME27]|jgi:transcriptional regulator with XRE-family HTH domain|uniref:Helix-turn-helix domain-containing protein n=2 Tax=Endobacterium cereale TaxID=2663029 RepID=A0A6A8A5F1_9HYPH|nr:helix-turn-helix transcriptional regulator [Endobacterium cereale]MQY46485.1 helix-turn-helix domain-containing protein [Endobacterium cereale]